MERSGRAAFALAAAQALLAISTGDLKFMTDASVDDLLPSILGN